MSLLYVMHEHPSVSESFVVKEAAAVEAHGVTVFGYALKRGAADRPAAEIELIQPPPSKSQLAAAAMANLATCMSAIQRTKDLERRESARLALAETHAAYALPSARAAGVTHAHAHFLGRTADVASVLARELGCRWSATAHGDDVYAPAEPGLLRMRLQGAAAVACASDDVRDHLNQHAESSGAQVTTRIVRCGIDTSSLRFVPNEPTPRHIISIGRLVENKGYLTALAAVKELMGTNAALRWTIVGDGPLRGVLEEEVKDVGFDGRISFAGALDHQRTLSLLAAAGIFVLPCQRGPEGDSDGIPVALMEAMAVGVPVVTTAVGGIRELVDSGKTGYLIPPEDRDALAATLSRILDPKWEEELARVRLAARKRIEREFDQADQAQSLLDLLGDVPTTIR